MLAEPQQKVLQDTLKAYPNLAKAIILLKVGHAVAATGHTPHVLLGHTLPILECHNPDGTHPLEDLPEESKSAF